MINLKKNRSKRKRNRLYTLCVLKNMELKPIPICPKYHVSQDGETVLNTKTGRTLHQGDQLKDGEPTGYKYVTLLFESGEYKCKRIAVHRLVLITYQGINPGKPWAKHKNGIKSDNRIDNLEWMTASEKIRHSFEVLGRVMPKGEENGNYGKKASKETKHKQSIAKLGKNHPKYKGIYIVDGKKFYSALECQQKTGVSQKTVIRRCKGPKNKNYSFLPDPNREL